MGELRDITNLVRALVDDIPEATYTDDVLLPLVNSIHRDVQSRLAENGVTTQVDHVELALAANATEITSSSTPALPSDFIVPFRMWEKPTVGSDKFKEMIKWTNGLPDLDQGQDLKIWEWLDGVIALIGSTRAITVKIRYEKELADLSIIPPGNSIKIRGAVDALAYGTAHLINPKGQPAKNTNTFASMYEEKMHQLINRNIRPEQRRSRRRKPYGWPK